MVRGRRETNNLKKEKETKMNKKKKENKIKKKKKCSLEKWRGMSRRGGEQVSIGWIDIKIERSVDSAREGGERM